MPLDIDFVRQQFVQLNDEPDFVFASNAGGSYVCNQVNDLLEHYNRHTDATSAVRGFSVSV